MAALNESLAVAEARVERGRFEVERVEFEFEVGVEGKAGGGVEFSIPWLAGGRAGAELKGAGGSRVRIVLRARAGRHGAIGGGARPGRVARPPRRTR